MYIDEKGRKQFIAGLREAADFFENNPQLKVPLDRDLTVYSVTGADLATFARAFGKCDKVTDDFSFQLVHTLPSGFQLKTYTSRENVCKRVLVKTEEVPAHTIPAVPEKFIEASTRNVYEWECPESILGMAETTTEEEEVLIGTIEDEIPF